MKQDYYGKAHEITKDNAIICEKIKKQFASLRYKKIKNVKGKKKDIYSNDIIIQKMKCI